MTGRTTREGRLVRRALGPFERNNAPELFGERFDFLADPLGPERPGYYEAAATRSSSVMRTRLGSTFTPGPMVDDSVTDLT